jgi:serine/threonine protein kinase
VKVAVKHMKVEDEKTRQYCRGEIEAHQAFTHPACLGYVTSKDAGSHILLATPLMPYRDLQRGINLEWNGTPYVEWETIKTICVFGIAFGMEYIHSRGFVHRDLKPANIFMNAQFRPVIGDFGLTRRTGSGPGEAILSPTLLIGTPLHMAPEVFSGDSESYTQAVDVYSYAVLLYSLYCRDPLNHLDDKRGPPQSQQNLMRRVDKGVRFERVPGITDSYWQLITTMWSQNPSARGTFSDIVDVLVSRPADFMIAGSKPEIVMGYIEEMKPHRPT